jgi:hypothetical protein
MDAIDHFLLSSVAFTMLRTILSRVLLSPRIVDMTGLDKDNAHLISLVLSTVIGACVMVAFTLVETAAKAGFYSVGMLLAWSLIYGNFVMIIISGSMIVLLLCLYLRRRAVAEMSYIILGSLEYSFICVYTVSELVTRGNEGMEDALADVVSLEKCAAFMPCVVRVTTVWALTIMRIAICLGQIEEVRRAALQAEGDRVKEEVAKALDEARGEAEEEAEDGDDELSGSRASTSSKEGEEVAAAVDASDEEESEHDA